jgi:hypothetical protein
MKRFLFEEIPLAFAIFVVILAMVCVAMVAVS